MEKKILGICVLIFVCFFSINCEINTKIKTSQYYTDFLHSSWVQIFRQGTINTVDKRSLKITQDELCSIFERFYASLGGIPVLYEHGRSPRAGMAAGWVDYLELRTDGIYAHIYWTDMAAKELLEHKWKYTSVRFESDTDCDGFTRPKRIVELSLVNIPAMQGLKPILD